MWYLVHIGFKKTNHKERKMLQLNSKHTTQQIKNNKTNKRADRDLAVKSKYKAISKKIVLFANKNVDLIQELLIYLENVLRKG